MSRITTPLPFAAWTFSVRAESGRRVVCVHPDGQGGPLALALTACQRDDAALEIDLTRCQLADSLLLNALMALRARAAALGIPRCALTGIGTRLGALLDRFAFGRAFDVHRAA